MKFQRTDVAYGGGGAASHTKSHQVTPNDALYFRFLPSDHLAFSEWRAIQMAYIRNP
jgi:hypothetical protein